MPTNFLLLAWLLWAVYTLTRSAERRHREQMQALETILEQLLETLPYEYDENELDG